jgi:hypothetical protein
VVYWLQLRARLPETNNTNERQTMNILNLLPYIRQTRRYGHTYIHAEIRKATASYTGFAGTLDGEPVRATFCGWGRSLQARKGHKYKAHIRFETTGKPVPSARLSEVRPV